MKPIAFQAVSAGPASEILNLKLGTPGLIGLSPTSGLRCFSTANMPNRSLPANSRGGKRDTQTKEVEIAGPYLLFGPHSTAALFAFLIGKYKTSECRF
ncbi:hypothetical protein DACRYDRAFT_24896 [Dacryopinax primogenitus]|uniref:Uncharacterized protein n=1 Tax=Dacryopinax primogenitus (strain DJM 731) TaxID=1858805 RepID=M5FX08_DACPD|nr:uncharacterized protein DACRYDRAFT_24896 [Dacryopinax primogenitus]EJT97996.1 hypothetical protein DACRYDRAFT_24896 [Dacryopinax primogenitus]